MVAGRHFDIWLSTFTNLNKEIIDISTREMQATSRKNLQTCTVNYTYTPSSKWDN